MIRTVGIVLAAIVLSFVLTAAWGYAVATGADARLMLDVSADLKAGRPVGEQRADEMWNALERARVLIFWVYNPAIALIVGAFVGLTSRRWVWQLALAGAAPFAVTFSLGTRGALSGLPFLFLYLAVAALAGWSASVLLNRLRAREAR
jgi:hypothetical protein